MTTQTGLWIDHRKAVIAVIDADTQDLRLITSDVEKQPRRSGDSPLAGPYESQKVPADDSRQTKSTAELNTYYDAVIAEIGAAESIFIFGPGEGKIELKKRIEERNPHARIVGCETADKMTDRQVAARVREFFHA